MALPWWPDVVQLAPAEDSVMGCAVARAVGDRRAAPLVEAPVRDQARGLDAAAGASLPPPPVPPSRRPCRCRRCPPHHRCPQRRPRCPPRPARARLGRRHSQRRAAASDERQHGSTHRAARKLRSSTRRRHRLLRRCAAQSSAHSGWPTCRAAAPARAAAASRRRAANTPAPTYPIHIIRSRRLHRRRTCRGNRRPVDDECAASARPS